MSSGTHHFRWQQNRRILARHALKIRICPSDKIRLFGCRWYGAAKRISFEILVTELIPEILTMVDSGKIALTPAVELSYLTRQEQQDLLETMESEDCTPSLSQAIQLKKLSQAGELDMDKIFDILREPKANQQDKISFRVEDLRKFFPKSYTAARIQETILKLLSDYQKKRQRENAR